MDHAIGGAPAAAQEAPRPGWWWTIGNVIWAWLGAFVVMLVATFALDPVAFDPSLAVGQGWPWAPDGVWAIVAGGAPVLAFAVVFALVLRFSVERRSESKLLLWPAMLPQFALLAFPSDTRGPQGEGALAFWALVLTVVFVRRFAVVPARNPWRPQRWLIVAIGVAALALTAATLAYRPLHPLDVQLGEEVSGSGQVTYGVDEDANPRTLPFSFDNDSFADARIVTATALSDGAPVVVQFANPEPEFTPLTTWAPVPAGGIALTPGASDSAVIRLAPGLCRDRTNPRAEVRGLELQVETLGMLRTQRVVRDAPVTLHCPVHQPG